MDENMMATVNNYGKKPAWFWIMIYLFIGGAIYAGYYYYSSGKTGYQTQDSMGFASPTPSSAVEAVNPAMIEETQLKEYKVEITTAGYSPAVLSISVGDTVTWTYTGDKSSNVSSDPHPEHTDYSPLNLGMFKAGATQSLTFDQPGTYGYHNHFNASQVGTIIVK